MNKQTLRNIVFVGLFLVPFIPFLVSSSFFFPFITTKAFAWRIIIEIIFAAWLMLVFTDASYRPKRSYILYSILGFLGIVALADIFGLAPLKSFWSNFERMEGLVTLFHLGMFFLVISSVFKELDWKRWWNTTLVASFLMVLYSAVQILGLVTINQGGVRVDGTFGNAIYLAVYMLFHIFIATLFLWRERASVTLRCVYGILIFLQVIVLYYTATRGAILGLIGGLLFMAVLSVFNKENRSVRRFGAATLLGLIVLVGGFLALRDTNFVTSSPVLSRFSSLNTAEIKTQGRYFIWPMALEGVKERPILGWGQENFSYVFQKHYSPEMFRLEPWFDRAHNIFLDWLIAAGILGLLSYLTLYGSLLFLIWRPSLKSDGEEDTNFSYAEKSILTGLVAAYFFHNLFVFDHLFSYILFFSLLAYVHQRKGGVLLGGEKIVTKKSTRNIIGVAILVLLVLSVHFINIKPIRTNTALISALSIFQIGGPTEAAIENFSKAYESSRLGRSEVVEHLSSNSLSILTSDISTEEKNKYFNFARNAVIKQNEDLENDARYELLAGSFFSSTGQLDEALVHLAKAQQLIPGKQQVYFEAGSVYINKNEPLEALKFFKEAYQLAPEYGEAKIIYLIGAIYAGDKAVESELLIELTENEIVFDDRIINAYYTSGRIDSVRNLLNDRIRLDPSRTDVYLKDLETLAN